MTLETKVEVQGFALTDQEERRIRHHLQRLERHGLAHRPEPRAVLVLRQHQQRRQIEVNVQVQLGPLGAHVVSHQTAETADRAVRLAIEDIERQLERIVARQRGEETFGVPSRRLPKQLRPHPPGRGAAAEEAGPETAEEAGEPEEAE